MKFLAAIVLSISFSASTWAQMTTDTTFYLLCNFQPPPEFPGGMKALQDYLNEKTQEENFSKCTGGEVSVQCIIDESGSVIEPRVLKGFSNDCDGKVLSILESMPQWNPTIKYGQPIKTVISFPIRFTP